MAFENWTDFINICPQVEIPGNFYESFRSLAANKHLDGVIEAYFTKCNAKKHENKKSAAILRDKGNEMFNERRFVEAVKYYNKCLVFVHEYDELFPLVLANRGMVLMKMNLFENALKDFQISLETEYPEELKYKIYYRMAVCNHHLNLKEEFQEYFNLCEEKLRTLDNESEKNTYEKDLKNIKSTEKIAERQCSVLVKVPEIDLKNEKLDGADEHVQLIYSEDLGRFVIATRNFSKNEILFVEKPFSFIPMILDKKYILEGEIDVSTVCDFCGSYLINFEKCADCSLLFYCSTKCRNNAWGTYHRFECAGLKKTVLNNIGIGFLALRTLLKAVETNFGLNDEQFEKLISSENIMKTEDYIEYLQKSVEGSDNLLDYFKVFKLLHHLDKMEQPDLLQYSMTCMMMTSYLEKFTQFFLEFREKVPACFPNSEIPILLSVMMMRHFGQIITNAQTIYRSAEDLDANRNFLDDNISGVALYPSVSMMNHSCKPNINITYFENTIIVKAGQDIEQNKQIFNCYGHNSKNEDARARRETLKNQYHFECNCESCLEEMKMK